MFNVGTEHTTQTTLTIIKYKKIESSILKDFVTVNWLVGTNSSGKTSVINAASHLVDGGNAKTYCREGTRNVIERIERQEYNSIVELRRGDIEEYYPNLDASTYEQFVTEFDSVKTDYKKAGEVKRKYAELISLRISSPGDFSKLFDSELDFLLR